MRSSTDSMHRVGYTNYQLDQRSGKFISIAGLLPVVCHSNALTAEIFKFFKLAGIHLNGEYLFYKSEDDAKKLIKELILIGKKIIFEWPPSEEIYNNSNPEVKKELYSWLNNKANIDSLCKTQYQPHHELFDPNDLSKMIDFLPEQAIFAKLCHNDVTGGGADVYFCSEAAHRKSLLDWVASRPKGWNYIRVEEALEVKDSWCLCFFISPTKVTYLGAAIQLFESPGKQSGSLIDPEVEPSDRSIAIAKDIAERAASLGFKGIVGFDIGEDVKGQPYVFDLNFRDVRCSSQILFHTSATRRINCNVSKSWVREINKPLALVIEKLEIFVCKGYFVPLYLFESTSVELPSRIFAMLIGKDRIDLQRLESDINHSLTVLGE